MILVGLADARHLPLPDGSVDAILCDPPYGLEFMGKKWDAPWKTGDGFRRKNNPTDAGRENVFGRTTRSSPQYIAGLGFQEFCELWATEAYRVLKPGGHLLAFGGTRTFHRLTCGIEDAGFEVRDSIGYGCAVPIVAWMQGAGFPKSRNVSKAIDEEAGAEREIIGTGAAGRSSPQRITRVEQGYRENLTAVTPEAYPISAPATDAARRWAGWGTALKPAWEPIVVARKPLAGTVAANVLAFGTGALNIDGCRVAVALSDAERNLTGRKGTRAMNFGMGSQDAPRYDTRGRWPSNVVLSHAGYADPDTGEMVDACASGCVDGCPVAELDAQSGDRRSHGQSWGGTSPNPMSWGVSRRDAADRVGPDDTGGASRFFPTFRYQAKAPARERPKVDGYAHSTVKPLALMRWLARLITRPGGTVLDMFAGSGPTVEAAMLEGFHVVAFDNDAKNIPLIRVRINRTLALPKPPTAVTPPPTLF